MLPTVGFENSSPQTQRVPNNRCTQIRLDVRFASAFFPLLGGELRWNRSPSDCSVTKPNLQIRMVAGYREVAERKEKLVAGVGFEPTTSGL